MKKKNKKKKGKAPLFNYSTAVIPKALDTTRADVRVWKQAQTQFRNVDSPKNFPIYNLYEKISLDLLLTSQINNRKQKSVASSFSIKKATGEVDEETTLKLKNSKGFKAIMSSVLDPFYYGHSLIELAINGDDKLVTSLLPRQHVLQQQGIIIKEVTDDKGTEYRLAKEYNVTLLEFGKSHDMGILNKIIPHVLFKRFAQSCWSELCEIYGIPPRVMKTNTQDPAALNRAKKMMTEWGAAAWFIIDDTEQMDFAKSSNTSGDVYQNLINLCNNEISMGISGAIIGQDTKNGSRGKEQSSQEVLQDLVDADKTTVQTEMNDTVMRALFLIGFIPDNCTFEFDTVEDVAELWTRTKEVLPYKNVEDQWLIDKFGIQVTGDRVAPEGNNLKLDYDPFLLWYGLVCLCYTTCNNKILILEPFAYYHIEFLQEQTVSCYGIRTY